MKILQINAVCDSGSTGRTTRELSDWLLAHGHDSLVVYGNGHSDYPHAVKISSNFDNKLHGFLARLTGYNAHFSSGATQKLFRIIENFQPDVVHLRNLHGNNVDVPKLLRYLGEYDIPTVITLHDCWLFTGKCTHYTAVKCSSWQEHCGKCPRLKQDIPSWFFDHTAEMLREKRERFEKIPRLAVVGVSDWITNEARRSILSSAKIITRIYNWIDTEVFRFHPEAKVVLGLAPNDFAVLFISAGWSLSSTKYRDLEKLAVKLNEQGIAMLLAGQLPVDAPVLKLPMVKYLGYLKSTLDLANAYSAADVYVHLSREDTFGKVIAEALACGTPAIVYDTTALSELVPEGCGFVVPEGMIDEIMEKILTLRINRKEYCNSQCITFAHSSFDSEGLMNNYMKLYSNVILPIK